MEEMKQMSKEEKDKLVEEVMKGFDFERAYSIIYLTKMHSLEPPTIKELKERAERYLRIALDHQDREFWWIGGMTHGGLCACWDDKWGLSLIYVGGVSRVKKWNEY